MATQSGTKETQVDMFAAQLAAAEQWIEGFTAGKWRTSFRPVPTTVPSNEAHDTGIKALDGSIIAAFEVSVYAPGDHHESAANCRRAVTCVNALQGVRTRDIEKLPEGLLAEFVAGYLKQSEPY